MRIRRTFALALAVGIAQPLLTHADGTQIALQAFLFDENHSSAIGSAFGVERSKHDANGNLVSESFHGAFQYAIPEENKVYSGTFFTGRRIKDTSGG